MIQKAGQKKSVDIMEEYLVEIIILIKEIAKETY